jgi:hypothetical protein
MSARAAPALHRAEIQQRVDKAPEFGRGNFATFYIKGPTGGTISRDNMNRRGLLEVIVTSLPFKLSRSLLQKTHVARTHIQCPAHRSTTRRTVERREENGWRRAHKKVRGPVLSLRPITT